jgi:hypothetical protein
MKYSTPPIKSLYRDYQKIQVLMPSWILENNHDTDLEDDLGERISALLVLGPFFRSKTGDCTSDDRRRSFFESTPTGAQGDSLKSMLSKNNMMFDMPQLDLRLSTSNQMPIC